MFTVFYRPDCPFSRQAILLLERQPGIAKSDINLVDIKARRLDLIELLHDHGIFHHRTVPAVFNDDRFIGGYDDLRRHFGIPL